VYGPVPWSVHSVICECECAGVPACVPEYVRACVSGCACMCRCWPTATGPTPSITLERRISEGGGDEVRKCVCENMKGRREGGAVNGGGGMKVM